MTKSKKKQKRNKNEQVKSGTKGGSDKCNTSSICITNNGNTSSIGNTSSTNNGNTVSIGNTNNITNNGNTSSIGSIGSTNNGNTRSIGNTTTTNTTTTNTNNNTNTNDITIPIHILDAISVRFLLQINVQDIENIERLFFVLEEAHWFYIDIYNSTPVPFDKFCTVLVNHIKIPINVINGLNIFKEYKKKIKVFGCIIFDTTMTSVLVVKENKSIPSYGFPKGKKNMNENGYDCAIREVYEEIGYDVSTKIIKTMSFKVFEKMTFYFVLNVSVQQAFVSKMKNEIKEIAWIPVWKIEKNVLGRNYSIVTKSYPVWRKLYNSMINNKYKFDRMRILERISSVK